MIALLFLDFELDPFACQHAPPFFLLLSPALIFMLLATFSRVGTFPL